MNTTIKATLFALAAGPALEQYSAANLLRDIVLHEAECRFNNDIEQTCAWLAANLDYCPAQFGVSVFESENGDSEVRWGYSVSCNERLSTPTYCAVKQVIEGLDTSKPEWWDDEWTLVECDGVFRPRNQLSYE